MSRRGVHYYKSVDSLTAMKITRLVFFLAGVCFVILGAGMFLAERSAKETCTEPVTALVDGLERKVDDEGSTMYAPRYVYEYGGEQYTYHSTMFSYPPAHEEGDTVQGFVDPDNPRKLYVPDDAVFELLGMIFTPLGVIFLIVSIVLTAKIRKRKSQYPPDDLGGKGEPVIPIVHGNESFKPVDYR